MNYLVFPIIILPIDVTLDAISKQGSAPFYAPVKPYTELADILSANYLPSNTPIIFLNYSISSLLPYYYSNYSKSFLAYFN